MKREAGKLIVGAVAVLLVGCGPHADSNSAGGSEVQAAPEIALPVKRGAPPVPLSAWKGKVVLLDFWATWCGPCRESIPEIELIYQKYHAKGLEVVGISTDAPSDVPKIAAAMKKLGMTYPVVLSSDIPDIETKYEHPGLPHMFLIDKKGNISDSITGYRPGSNLDAKVEALLNEKL